MPSLLRQRRDHERRQATRERLLQAAATVFADKGYHRTLVSDIVTEAGVGQGTFYRCFDTKRAVFGTLQEQLFDELLGQFSDMQAHPPTDVAGYRRSSLAAIRRLVAVLEARRDVASLMLREAPSIDREAEQALTRMLDGFAEVARYYLDRAIEQGFARPCNSAVVAQSIIGIAMRHLRRWTDGAYAGADLDELVGEVVDFAFLGFAPRTDGDGA